MHFLYYMTQTLFYVADLARGEQWSRSNVEVVRAIDNEAKGNEDKSIKSTLQDTKVAE